MTDINNDNTIYSTTFALLYNKPVITEELLSTTNLFPLVLRPTIPSNFVDANSGPGCERKGGFVAPGDVMSCCTPLPLVLRPAPPTS